MRPVVSFLESYSKLDLDSVCGRTNVLSGQGSAIEQKTLPSQKPSRVRQCNFLLFQLQSLNFGGQMRLVVSFLESYSKLDLDSVCGRTNVLSGQGSAVEQKTLPSQKPSRIWQCNFLLFQLQSLNFGGQMRLVINFPESYSKLDLDNACERNNVLSGQGSAALLGRGVESLNIDLNEC